MHTAPKPPHLIPSNNMSHTRKKPYHPSSQPSITSFFPSSSSSSSPSSGPQPSSAPTRSPLPDSIQSSLLNVGMRVRKSVPEGYKTHKTLPSSFPYAAAAGEVRALSTRPEPYSNGANTRRTRGGEATEIGAGERRGQGVSSSAPTALVRSPSDRSRELQPFCGLHSVGGIGSQEEEAPGLGWSQPSLASMSSESESEEVESGRKRGLDHDYEEEVEAELDGFFEGLHGGEGERRGQVEGRKIKAMRGRREMLGGAKGGMSRSGVEVEVLGDFEDGDVGFLEPMDVDVLRQ